jgi:hypothetical protein
MKTEITEAAVTNMPAAPVAASMCVKAVLFNRATEEVDVPHGTTVREVAMLVSHPNPDSARALDDANNSYGPTDVLPTDRPKLFLSFVANVAGSCN